MPSSDNSSLMVHILSFQKTNKLELVLTAEMLSTSGRTAEETSLPRNLFNTVHFPLIRGGFVQFRLNVFSLRPMCYVCALVSRPSTDLLVNFQSTLSKKKILYTTSFLLFLSFFFPPIHYRPPQNSQISLLFPHPIPEEASDGGEHLDSLFTFPYIIHYRHLSSHTEHPFFL